MGHLYHHIAGSGNIKEDGEERLGKTEDEKFDAMLFSGQGTAVALMNPQPNLHRTQHSTSQHELGRSHEAPVSAEELWSVLLFPIYIIS